MRILFPIDGLNEGVAMTDQPPTTSPALQNVRPYDIEERRGGQRRGLEKAYTTQVGGDHPVIGIITVATTYIEPS